MTVLSVMPGKTPEKVELDGSLESMQEFVGGTIQAVYPFSDLVAVVCADEGKLMGLEYNRVLWGDDWEVYDILCGPFFVCGLGEEDFTSLPEELMEKYFRRFEHPELFIRVGNSLLAVPF